MSISKRHHFIPKYYLNNFTNEDNTFYIFDKKNPKKILRRSPKQVCFEDHRNSMFGKSNIPHPYLEEKVYGFFDNKHAQVFNELCNNKVDLEYWSIDRVHVLEYLIPFMYWRNPKNDQEFDNIINSMKSLHELDLTISNGNSGDEIDDLEFHKEILNTPDFRKAARINYGIKTFRHNVKKHKELEWRVYDYQGFGGFVTSDFPLLFKNKILEIADLRGDVILPVSPYRSFMRIDENKENNFPTPAIQNFSQIHYADRFVISHNKEYLELLVSEYNRISSSGEIDDLLKKLWVF